MAGRQPPALPNVDEHIENHYIHVRLALSAVGWMAFDL
jgi:hypothetical protein